MRNLIQTITIKGIIEQPTSESFKASFAKLENGFYGINIDTVGGKVKATSEIIYLMQTQKMPAVSFGGKNVGSSGLYIYLQGFYRICLAETHFLIHRHSGPDNKFDIAPTEEEMMYFKLVSRITKISLERVVKFACNNNGAGTTFFGKEAIDLGFAHNIVRY